MTARTFTFTVTAPTRAYTPGHWVQFNSGTDSQSTMQTALNAAPTVKGCLKRYYWKELESSQGTYTLSELLSDLDWCHARGKKFIPMLVDKSFDTDSTNGANPLPSYLASQAVVNQTGGYTALKWTSPVVARFKALLQALKTQASARESYASLEGFATQETSLGLTDAQMRNNGYTPEVFGDYYIDLITWAASTFPTKRTFWFFNFIASLDGEPGQPQIDRVITATKSLGLAAGGPDCWPTSGAGNALRNLTYPKYETHKNDCPLFVGMSVPSYTDQPLTIGGTGAMPMADVFAYARDTLRVNYVWWMWRPTGGGNDFVQEGAAVIAANPTFNVESW
jgi:hypothetical protein